MANEFNIPGEQCYFDMGVPRVTPDGLVSWGGVGMAPMRVFPKLQGQVLEGSGPGVYPTGTRVPGPRGALDVWAVTGTAGTARCLAALYDSTTGARILIGLDTQNRPQCVVTDNSGTSVFASTPAGAAIAADVRMHLQVIWNALNPLSISVTDRAALFRDGALLESGRTTTWTHFLAPSLYAGAAVSTFSAFNGILESVQAGTQPSI